MRGVSSLYAELALLLAVLAAGSTLLTALAGIDAGVHQRPPRVCGYLVRGKLVVASWEERPVAVKLVCPGSGELAEVEVEPGAWVLEPPCPDVVLVSSGYVITPVEVIP